MSGRLSVVCALMMSISLGLAGLFALSAPKAEAEASHGGDVYEGHEYLLIQEELTWEQANTDCVDRGGHLVTISSQGENDFVRSLIELNELWIGFTDKASEGNFVWVTGEDVSYQNWNWGEPNDGTYGEDYALMLSSGFWNDAPTDWLGDPITRFYVIEWDEANQEEEESSYICCCCCLGLFNQAYLAVFCLFAISIVERGIRKRSPKSP